MQPLKDARLEEQLRRFEGYLTARQIGVLRGLLNAESEGRFTAGASKKDITDPIFADIHGAAIADPRRSGYGAVKRFGPKLEKYYRENEHDPGPVRIKMRGMRPVMEFAESSGAASQPSQPTGASEPSKPSAGKTTVEHSLPEKPPHQIELGTHENPIPSQDRQLAALKRTLHVYHMTENDGRPPQTYWWYKSIDFGDGKSPTVLEGHGVNVPRAGTPKHEYDYELSIDKGHLVVWAHRSDGKPDISVAIFPDAICFPYCGFFVVTKTWAENPASSICILSDEELACAKGATPGEPITDPHTTAALSKVWRDHAKNFVRLPPAKPEPKLWDNDVFNNFLAEVEPTGDGKADLRIASSLFHNLGNLGLDKPLSRNCRIEVIVINPAKEDLLRARYKLRTDFSRGGRTPFETALSDLKEQINDLPRLPQLLGVNSGLVDVKVSDVMPSGFLAMTRKRAILGAMLSTLPYDRGGPMVEVTPDNTVLWPVLEADWKARWQDAKTPAEAAKENASLPHQPVPLFTTPWVEEKLNTIRQGAPLHHYHVTVRKQERLWLYSQLDFSREINPGSLHTEVRFTFSDGTEEKPYRFRGERIGQVLIVRQDVTAPSENLTHTSVFPFFAASYNKDFAHGVAFHENFDHQSEFIPCLISNGPLLDIPVGQVPPEMEDQLETLWNDRMISTPINLKDLACHYRGNDFEASKYTSSRHHLLKKIRDTHVYSEGGDEKFANPETYGVIKAGLTGFLKNTTARFILVVGHQVDKKYIQLLIDAAAAAAAAIRESPEEVEKRIICRRVREATTHVTNFLILDYRDGRQHDRPRQEAVFGWGHHARGTPGRVFSSSDETLVREFDATFQNLCREDVSEEVPLLSLLQPYVSPPLLKSNVAAGVERRSDAHHKWDQDLFFDLLGRSAEDAEIQLLTTFFLNDDGFFRRLDDLLLGKEDEKGNRRGSRRNLKVMLVDPRPGNQTILERRWGTGKTGDPVLRQGWSAKVAAKRIDLQLESFEACQKRLNEARERAKNGKTPSQIGTLEVKVYDTVPTLVHYQVGDDLMLAFLLTSHSGDSGPMIHIKKDGSVAESVGEPAATPAL